MKAVLPLLLLSGCAMAPAHADALPPGVKPPSPPAQVERLPPGDSLGYRPATFPRIPGGVSYYRIFDPPITRGRLLAVAKWSGAPAGFVIPATALSRWNGTPPPPPPGLPPGMGQPQPKPPTPPNPPNQPEVPGPVPLLGLGAAFIYSRKLRQRIQP